MDSHRGEKPAIRVIALADADAEIDPGERYPLVVAANSPITTTRPPAGWARWPRAKRPAWAGGSRSSGSVASPGRRSPLAGAMGERWSHRVTVHAYGPIYGSGAAVVEFGLAAKLARAPFG